MKKNIAAILFIALTAIDITGIACNNNSVHLAMKPLLMPALVLLLFSAAAPPALIIAGLLFSWAGDVLLMFESRNALFFIFGLVSFLLTHVCYITYFLKIRSPKTSLVRQQPWIAALVAGYGASLVLFLLPHLGALKIPVLVYALVICSMLVCSLHVFNKVNRPANILFVAGAVLFTASDSLLAVNKFYQSFAGAAVLIMLTYCAAQLCIVQGVIKRTDS